MSKTMIIIEKADCSYQTLRICSITETDSPKPGQIDISLIRVQRRHADLLKPDTAAGKRDGSQATITRSATVPNMNVSPPLTGAAAAAAVRTRQSTDTTSPPHIQQVSLQQKLIFCAKITRYTLVHLTFRAL